MTDFHYQPLFELGADDTPYRRLTGDGVTTVSVNGRELLTVDADVLRLVARTAFDDIGIADRNGIPAIPRTSMAIAIRSMPSFW